jgi:hypothetical protein
MTFYHELCYLRPPREASQERHHGISRGILHALICFLYPSSSLRFNPLHIMLPLKLHMPCLVLFSLLFAIAFYQTFISEKKLLEYEPRYAVESA